MKTINLKFYLMLLMALTVITCLCATSFFILYQADKQSKLVTHRSAISLAKQIRVQIVRKSVFYTTPSKLPDFSLWRESEQHSGLCARFTDSKGKVKNSVCRGSVIEESWPTWFESLYRNFFDPGQEVTHNITHRKKLHGVLKVYPSAKTEIAQAWGDVKKLFSLSAITMTALCLLLFLVIGWILRPAQLIVDKLRIMSNGDLKTRIPSFHITEWQQTGMAINILAENLNNTLAERKTLAIKLVGAQEEERRYLTRELHDEFGQSLSGLTAVARSISQTANESCPALVREGKYLEQVSAQMMDQLRDLLNLLRPADFDELGLTESIKIMVNKFNAQHCDRTHFEVSIDGDFQQLPSPISINIYRIIQECLTNITKHSNATNAEIKLKRTEQIQLLIQDNGHIDQAELTEKSGFGILGIRERINALGGKMDISRSQSNGLSINVTIPLPQAQQIL